MPPCGTICCAVGWFPAIFDEVEWQAPGTQYYQLRIKNGIGMGYEDIASRILGTSKGIARGLFMPDYQTKAHPELPLCGTEATPDEVADMLSQFIELVRDGEIAGHSIEVGE